MESGQNDTLSSVAISNDSQKDEDNSNLYDHSNFMVFFDMVYDDIKTVEDFKLVKELNITSNTTYDNHLNLDLDRLS